MLARFNNMVATGGVAGSEHGGAHPHALGAAAAAERDHLAFGEIVFAGE